MRRGLPKVAAATLFAALLAGCGTTAATPKPLDLPLAGVSSTSLGEVATLAMGSRTSALNRFWQVFLRAPGATSWTLVTPPGVATNGGVVATATGDKLVVGILASQSLHFSVVEWTTDRGRTWSNGILPGALTSVPDALAAQGDRVVALLGARGDKVVESEDAGVQWRTAATLRSLRPVARHARCSLVGLTAVAWSSSGLVVAGSCADGGGVLLARRAASFTADSLLPGTVVRLSGWPRLDALVMRPTGAAHRTRWTEAVADVEVTSVTIEVSSVTIGAPVAATGTDDVVTISGATSCVAHAWEDTGGAEVVHTVHPPAGACEFAVTSGSLVALRAEGVQFDAFRAAASGVPRWQLVEHRRVPIQYGSSS